MSRIALLALVVAGSVLVGFVALKVTDEKTAGLVVSLIGLGLGIPAFLFPDRTGAAARGLRARIRLRNVDRSRVTGVERGSGDSDAHAAISAGNVKDSQITGVGRPRD
jgi:hypothetical protein